MFLNARNLRLFVLATELCLLGPTTLALAAEPPTQAELSDAERTQLTAEADRLGGMALRLLDMGRVREAIAAAERLIAIERRIRAPDSTRLAFFLDWLAHRCLAIEDYDGAKRAYTEAIDVWIQCKGEQHWEVANARWRLKRIEIFADFTPEQRIEWDRAAEKHAAMLAAFNGGDYKKAKPLADEALAIRERLLPNPHPDLADSINNVGMVLMNQGLLVDARGYFERAIAMRELVYPRDEYPAGHPDMALGIGNLATLLDNLGENRPARDNYEQALAMYERLYPAQEFPAGHLSTAIALNNLGFFLAKLAEYPAARDYYERALAMKERLYPKGDWNPDIALSLNNLGALLAQEGDPAGAMVYLERALAMARMQYPEKDYPKGHPDLARALNAIGQTAEQLGDYAKARDYTGLALEMYRRLYPQEDYKQGHTSLAMGLSNLGSLLYRLGDYKSARPLLEQALAMREALYPVELYKDGHAELALSLSNLGQICQEEAQFDQAKVYLNRSLEMVERLYPPGHPDIAVALNNLGAVYNATEEFAAARDYRERVLKIYEALYPVEKYPNGHPDIALALNNLGAVLHNMHDLAGAWVHYERAVAMKELLFPKAAYPEGHPDLALSMSNLANVYAGSGELEQALAMFDRVDRMRRHTLRTLFAGSSEATMRNYLAANANMTDLLLTLEQMLPESQPARMAALDSVLARKTTVLDALLRQRQFERLAQGDAKIAEQSARLRGLRQQMADLALRPSSLEIDQRRLEVAAEANELERQLSLALSTAGASAAAPDASLENLFAHIPVDAAVIEFVRFQPAIFEAVGKEPLWKPARYAAFVLQRSAPPRFVDLGEAAGIDTLVKAVRDEVVDVNKELTLSSERDLEGEYMKAAAALSAALVAPLALEGNVRWIVSTDGNIAQVPWEGLLDGAGRYLVETHDISYVNSATELLRQRNEPSHGTVIFAAPDYRLDGEPAAPSPEVQALLRGAPNEALAGDLLEDLRAMTWSDLDATREEAKKIKALLAGNAEYGPALDVQGPAALEDVFKRLRAPRVLHLATHGFYLPPRDPAERRPPTSAKSEGERLTAARGLAALGQQDNPLFRSGFVLAGANRKAPATGSAPLTPADDGWVTAEEIGLLDLAGTELVVLSACETGLGDVRPGEGVSGLRRAFTYAGAESLIASLYKVPDVATQALMVEFYTRLAAGAGKQRSLRQAQLEIIKRRRDEKGAAHPFFWASFILVGNPD